MQKNKVTVDKIDEVILVGGSTYIPKVREIVEKFTNKTAHSRIPPELVVAHGAAILAALIGGTTDEKLTFSDIISHDIGVEVKGSEMSTIVHKHSHLPCNKAEKYQTMSANQTSINLKILEGNSLKSAENKLLKQDLLSGFKPSMNSSVSFEISLRVNLEGIIDVTVNCLDSEWVKTLQCQSTASTIVTSPEEIDYSRKRVQKLLSGQSILTTETSPETKSALERLERILAKAKTLDTDPSEFEKIEKWIKDNQQSCCSLKDVESKTQKVFELAGEWSLVLKKIN